MSGITSCHAVEHAGVIHTLKRMHWPTDDHRRDWKWQAFADGDQWRLFRSVKDWRQAIPSYHRPKRRGPNYEAAMRAVAWSEFEGRQALDRLAESTSSLKGQTGV